jgi:hypothetical protein
MSIVPGIETEPEPTQASLQVVDLSTNTDNGAIAVETSKPDVEQTPTGNNAPVAEVTEPTQPPATQVDEVLEALMGAIAPAHMATKHVKIFIYGAEGCGKTVLAAQSPGALIADCDKEGAISLLNFPSLRETKVMPVRSIFAVEKLIGYLKAGHPNFDWVETLVIDPFDDLVYRGLSEQVRNTPGGFNNQERMNQFLAEGYDYNINTERFHQMMDEIKSLDRHVIITAHVTEKEDKSTGRIMIRSNITPKLATIIGGAVSLVGYMQYDAGKNERILYTAPTPTVTAKSRLALPPTITNPSFNTILEAFNKIKDAN